MVGRRSWMVVGGSAEIMTCHGWSWVEAAKLWLAVDGCGWLRLVVDGRMI